MKYITLTAAVIILTFAISAHSNELYPQYGKASWYGSAFHGNKTASGQIFNQNALTGANRTLPFGSIVRVTNLRNGKSVDVTINDRGPFIKGRIIDVSREAAKRIGIIHHGVTRVRLNLLYIP